MPQAIDQCQETFDVTLSNFFREQKKTAKEVSKVLSAHKESSFEIAKEVTVPKEVSNVFYNADYAQQQTPRQNH